MQGTSVGAPVTATDPDNDTLSYSLGGADASSFAMDGGGQITVGAGTVLDHEAGRSYTVTVTATDSHDASGSVEVTVTVTDVNEPPAKVDAPTIADQTPSSLSVEWDAPENSGRPAITDYDVGYRKVTDPVSSWSDAGHEGTGLSITLSDLAPGTAYQVRALARNDEGAGPWSDTAQGTTVANTAPEFGADTASRSVAENSVQGTNVGDPVTATDPDNDTLSYGITGPNPGGFTIDAATGQLRSGPAENYDFEDSAKSSYTVTVAATDPHGASANIAVTVTVSDEDEPPGRPAVSISGQTPSSLTVEWDAPENSGRPAITDYDVGYRKASDSGWTDHPHQGTGLSAVIGDLDPGTDYQVRVMARNDEGDGQWSDPAPGTTVANSAPDFGADTASRSVAENSVQGTNVGAPVTATDPDNDTLSYGITGPNPGGFTVDEQTGQLRSGPAENYDFEDSAKSSYTVTVAATDPHGASANIAVTVTVSDEDEPPGRPVVSISGQTLRSLTVEWDAPENSGRPAITDYDVEYREGVGCRLDGPPPRGNEAERRHRRPGPRHGLPGAGDGAQRRGRRRVVGDGPGHDRRQQRPYRSR